MIKSYLKTRIREISEGYHVMNIFRKIDNTKHKHFGMTSLLLSTEEMFYINKQTNNIVFYGAKRVAQSLRKMYTYTN
jgi:hypothetical protein